MTQRALENQSKQRLPSRNFPCIQAYVTLRTLMLASLTNLSPTEFWIVVLAVFSAGAVRGFAGFALSAILMASVVVILPPVDLIPLAFLLESAASLAMFRGGAKDADMSVVWVLAIGSIIGVPIGLYATVTISPDISKLVALIIVLSLALAQLFRLVPASMGNRAGLAVSGIVAGIVTGLASVGGMVVALYVLSSKAEAKTMRASLVMYLFVTMFVSIIYLFIYQVMTIEAVWRGLVFIPIVLAGVFVGSKMFRPSLVRFYRQFCLMLLVALSLLGLARMIYPVLVA
ncbi:MAG: putative membrane protein YfcA [Paracoccaceae bacterium]|jgi:uncharacterized membrane protein YfcA